MINVLLTAVGCPGGPSIIEALKADANIRIIGTDMRRDVPARYLVDKFVTVLPGRSPDFISQMLEICDREQIDVLLPLATFELDTLSKHKALFETSGCKVCVSDYEYLAIANNKFKLYETFRDAGIVPEYYLPASTEELMESVYKLGYPGKRVILRPLISHGSIGLRIVSSDVNKLDMLLNYKPNSIYTDLESVFEVLKLAPNFPEVLVTEYLPNKEYGVDLLYHPETHGFVQKFIRDNGEVNLSEVSGAQNIQTDKFDAIIDMVSTTLKLSYSVNIDIKLDERNEPKMLEINPRMPATSYLAYKSGFNMALGSVYLALGKVVQPTDLIDGLSIYSYRGFIVTNAQGKVL